MALVAMGVCVLTFFATGYWPSLAAQYPILVGAVDALAALYMGGNAAAQYVAAKHGARPGAQPEPKAKEQA